MLATLRKLVQLLTRRERRRGGLVLVLMIAMAFFEVAGIASVMPFLTVMGDPGMIERNAYLNAVYTGLGFESHRAFLIALALFGLAVLVLATSVRLVAQFTLIRFAQMRRHSVSRRLLYRHLAQPFEYFLTRNSADLSKTVLSEVDQLTENALIPALNVVAYTIVAGAVVAFLVVIDPWLALVLMAVIGGFYSLTYLLLRGYLHRIGRDRVAANRQRFKAAAEALGGIQELKVLGRERAFFDVFDPASQRFARHLASNELISKLPKRVVEMLGIAAVLGAAVYLLDSRESLGSVLPVLGAYAVAGNRLLPALQEVYQGVSKLRFGASTIDAIVAEMEATEAAMAATAPQEAGPLRIAEGVRLRQVAYTYPAQDTPALTDVEMTVPVGERVCIVGPTGAGKSTLVKLLLGLLSPSRGALEIDGRPLAAFGVRAWQDTIGYVPQDLFLVDDTVARNIALGVPDDEIDRDAVERAACRAHIHEVIVQQLPDGYDTLLGERGVRLSGGQRQRIAIARALYRRPQVLVLDEATSALDPETERQIVDDLLAQSHDVTLIAITHRDAVARLCDRVYRVDRGTLSLEKAPDGAAAAPAGARDGG
jgi:ABC-type multidrug transport system fused ATPase/permease subunit